MRRFRNNKPNYVIFTLSRDISEILLKCPFVHKMSKVLYHNSNNTWSPQLVFLLSSPHHLWGILRSTRYTGGGCPHYGQRWASHPLLCVFLRSASGMDPARMAVVVSSPRCGVSLAFANGVSPARVAVVLTPPLLAYARCAGSNNGGGVLAALLLPLVMDPGSRVGDSPVRTAVGFSSPHSGVPWPGSRGHTERMAVVVSLSHHGFPLGS